MKKNNQHDISALLNLFSRTDSISRQDQAKKLMNSLDENQHRQLNEILQDKNKIDALLKSSAAQKIINSIKSENNGQH